MARRLQSQFINGYGGADLFLLDLDKSPFFLNFRVSDYLILSYESWSGMVN